VQIYYETPQSLAARLPDDYPAYVLLNQWTIDHQWVGKSPWQNFHALEQDPGLERVGQVGHYQLFRVRDPLKSR
jgi:hypothetical protein